jgi:hypothetical protein
MPRQKAQILMSQVEVRHNYTIPPRHLFSHLPSNVSTLLPTTCIYSGEFVIFINRQKMGGFLASGRFY